MNTPVSLRELPAQPGFAAGDVLVLFGELFGRGYASGLVEQARAAGMDIIGITVGRRETDNSLRALNAEELAAAEANLGGRIINVPLMAGFDLDAPAGEPTVTDLLNKMTLKSWADDQLDWAYVERCRELGQARFRAGVAEVMQTLNDMIGKGRKVIFAHTMAGGIPRAKVFMVLANRIYKGRGERFMSSQALLDSDLGKLILQNFDEVSANTFGYLIEGSADLRARIESEGGSVSYTAYGYHGTEILIDGRYQWQTYTNYTQGYAKMRLEQIARDAWAQGVKATVFNCPEIRTNSTDVFAGVELPLISLLDALRHEDGGAWAEAQWQHCASLLQPEHSVDEVLAKVRAFQTSTVMADFRDFAAWPQPNSVAQADLQIGTSEDIVALHSDKGALITDHLSTLVLEASGALIVACAAAPQAPVLWLNHDIIARQLNTTHL